MGGDARNAVLRDSAGVTIVENAALGLQQWSLSDSALVVIGTLAGPPEQQLFDVNGAVRLPDGGIAIANGGTRQVRIYDAAGGYIGATGREGAGPGEFRSIVQLQLWMDSLLVTDSRLDRVSVLSLDGTFARSFMLPRSRGIVFSRLGGSFSDGTLLWYAVRGATRERPSGLGRDSLVFYRIDREGTILDSLGVFPGMENYIHSAGFPPLVMPVPFGRRASSAAAGQRFYYGAGERYEIQMYRANGALERLVRLDRPPRTVTPADIERAKQALRDRADDDPRRRDPMLADVPFPSAMPAYSRFRVDREGRLWVASFLPLGAPENEPATWTVFDADGRAIADVSVPPRFTVLDIGLDWVLGVRSDELDIEHVEIYRVNHPEKRGDHGRR